MPGSGKSTLARHCAGFKHIEADMYFGPEYQFEASQLPQAHKWCLDQTRKFLKEGLSCVVSNRFSTWKEIPPYLELQVDRRFLVECKGNYGNIHNVPDRVIRNMASRWENFEPYYWQFDATQVVGEQK